MSPPLGYADFQAPPPPPPLPLGRGWFWLAIASTVLSVAAAIVSSYLLAIWSDDDVKGFIDNDKILHVVRTECGRMTATVNGLPIGGSPHQVAGVIVQENAAVQTMLDAIGGLDSDLLRSDEPTEAWIADWETFLGVRAHLAHDLDRGNTPDLHAPTSADGESILPRMESASDGACPIPDRLLNPYPSEPDDEI